MLKKSDAANNQYTNIMKKDYEYDISTPQKYIEAPEEVEEMDFFQIHF